MNDTKIAVCTHCGSREVQSDTTARWDFAAQEWVVDDTFDKGGYCSECDGECRIEFVPAVDSEDERAKFLTEDRLRDSAPKLASALVECAEVLGTLALNAKSIPDPRMNGATDCYAVPLDDIEAISLPLLHARSAIAEVIPPS